MEATIVTVTRVSALLAVLFRNAIGCHDGGSAAVAICATKTAAQVATCKYCCWDGNQAWAVYSLGLGNDFCTGNGAGRCMDFSYLYGATGHTNTPLASGTGYLTVNTALTVTCNFPYYLVGPAIVTCKANIYTGCNDGDSRDPCVTCDLCAIWTTIPSCQLGCPPASVANSSPMTSVSGQTLTNGVYPSTTVASVNCPSPYYLVGTSPLTCTAGSWGTLPSCVLGCTTIPAATSRSVSYSPGSVATNLYPSNTHATFTCAAGSYLSATPVAPNGVCTGGSWGTLPTCILGCTATSIASGTVVGYDHPIAGTLYPAGTIVTFNCNSGYYLSTITATTTATCTSGSWITVPTCIQGCPASTLTNGVIVYTSSVVTNSVYQSTATAQFTCNTGYYLSTLTASKTLTCTTGSWGTAPTCTRGCNATAIINGGITFAPTTITNYVYQSAATAVFTCSTGYYLSTLTSSLTLTCTAGTWGTEPTCIQGCFATSLTYGSIVYSPSGTTNGVYQSAATATFSCNSGYYLNTLNPTEIQTCAASNWGPTLTCLKGCSASSINNGVITYNPSTTTNSLYQVGTGATFVCDVGFYLSSMQDVTVETCNSGSWGASLSCIEGCFEYENVTSGDITYNPNSTVNNVYQANSNASISCYTNYYTSGIDISNCSSGNWTSDLYCLLGCPPLGTFANGKTTYNPSTVSHSVYQVAAVATFSCEFGYKTVGSSNSKCMNGSWTNPIPSCLAAPYDLLILLMDISCTFLLIACGVSFMTFLLLREFSIETVLHMGEELSIFCAHILILMFKYRVDLGIFCRFVSISLQYFFIVAYTFFLLESLQFFCILQNIISFGGPWEYPRFRLLVIGWVFAFISTGITFALRYDYYVSTFSCWLNIGDDIAFGSIMPLAVLFVITVIMTEAAAMGNPKALPLTDWPQHYAAKLNQKSILIIMSFCTASWTLGMFACYSLTIFLGVTVSALNITLGVCIWVFHYMGTPASNAWFKKHIWHKLCKKKIPKAPVERLELVNV